MELTFRKACLSDAEQLMELVSELTEFPPDLPALKSQLRAIEADPCYQLSVACDGDTLAGTVTGIVCRDICGPCKPFLVIENVVTNPAYRGKGVGKGLFSWLEGWAREQGCYYSILVSTGTRTGAHAFYRSVGYGQECGFKKML